MKHLLAGLASIFIWQTGVAQSPPGSPQMTDLRLVVQQQAAPTDGMRQLTPQQRAELRRQVVEFSKSQGRRAS